MERPEHIALVTPPRALIAPKTNTSISKNSFGIPSKVSRCFDEQHHPASAGLDHSMVSRSALPPGKSGFSYPGQLTQSQFENRSWNTPFYEQFEFSPLDAVALNLPDDSAISSETPVIASAYPSSVASSRLTPQSKQDQLRPQSRVCASPSSHSTHSAFCSTEGFQHTAGWSTDSHRATPIPHSSPFWHALMPELTIPTQPYSIEAQFSSSTTPQLPHKVFFAPGNIIPNHKVHVDTMPIRGHTSSAMMMYPPMGPSVCSSNGMHQKNSHHSIPRPSMFAPCDLLDPMQHDVETKPSRGHHIDNSAPLDLCPVLFEEPTTPPPEDMNPLDPDLVPYEQELRFDGDMYTPKWVRGQGNKREGWCGICKPGRWLLLKTSTYWYDKSFTHGISAATGAPFQGPLDKRQMYGREDVLEGLCGNCDKWITLVSNKKKATAWFRHAYKCCPSAKIKDIPKRRRERVYDLRMSGPSLSSIGLGSMHEQQQQHPGTPSLLRPAASW